MGSEIRVLARVTRPAAPLLRAVALATPQGDRGEARQRLLLPEERRREAYEFVRDLICDINRFLFASKYNDARI